MEISGLHNLLLRKHGLITIYCPGTEEEEEDGTQKHQSRLLLVVFVCMKEDVTAASHMHGLEPPSNWVNTHVCINFMTE